MRAKLTILLVRIGHGNVDSSKHTGREEKTHVDRQSILGSTQNSNETRLEPWSSALHGLLQPTPAILLTAIEGHHVIGLRIEW